MKKKIIIIAFVLILLLAGYYWWHKHSAQSIPNPQVVAIAVEAQPVRLSTLPLEANAIGTVTAHTVTIMPEIAGHVAQILFKDGTHVKRGDTLVQLDDAAYKAKLSSANAQLVFSKNTYNRLDLLGKSNAVSKQALDQADADFKEKLANAKENEVVLDKLKLTAPFDGVVSKSSVNRGDYVNVAQSLVTVTDTYHLRVEYNIPEKYLPLLKLGQEVSLKSNTYPDRTFTGKVAYISPTINTDNRSVSLYADVPNTDELLASGMFVDVAQALGTERKVVMVPARALVPIIDGQQVYKVVDGKAYPVNVMTGRRTGADIQILQGLNAGDVVITDGQLKLRNGTPVKLKS